MQMSVPNAALWYLKIHSNCTLTVLSVHFCQILVSCSTPPVLRLFYVSEEPTEKWIMFLHNVNGHWLQPASLSMPISMSSTFTITIEKLFHAWAPIWSDKNLIQGVNKMLDKKRHAKDVTVVSTGCRIQNIQLMKTFVNAEKTHSTTSIANIITSFSVFGLCTKGFCREHIYIYIRVNAANEYYPFRYLHFTKKL